MGYGRSMAFGALAGLVVVVLVVAGVVYVLPSSRSPMSVPGERVLLVVGSRDGVDGSQVAHLIGVADASGGGLRVDLVDPMLKVSVPDTTYDRLRDAYPFGGGAGVSRAYASAKGGDPLPFIAVNERGLTALVDAAGGIETEIPAAANVFDGSRAFTFAPGPRRLSGDEVVALLSTQEYVADPGDRAALLSAVANALARGLSAPGLDLAAATAGGRVTSSLAPEDLASVGKRVRDGLANARIVSFAR